MSLLKWTLALAGTTMGMRYLSGRHRRRIANDSPRAAQTDRDDGEDTGRRSDAAWSAPQGGVSGLGSSPRATGVGLGAGAASVGHDALSTPDTDLTPGDPSNRF